MTENIGEKSLRKSSLLVEEQQARNKYKMPVR